MNSVPRPIHVAVCCLVLAATAIASAPDAPISSPPHTTPDTNDAQAAEMQAELQRAKDAVNAAKKAEDLDPVLFDLQKYENTGMGGLAVAPGNAGLLRQLLGALEFTKRWQDYLSHLAAGDAAQARNDLQALSQNAMGPGLIPRSRLLALMSGREAVAPAANVPAPTPEMPEAQKIIVGMNTLEDMSPALEKLNALAQQDELAREDAQCLAPMVEVYGDLKNGLPTSVNIDFMGGVTGAGVSIKINSLLLKFILQHYFDTYKGAPPRDDETPAAYVTRVKSDALAGQDWTLLKKALLAHGYFFRNVAAGGLPDNESGGVDNLIAGLNQSDAGQYDLAVESFLAALKSGSLDIPAKFIGAQLDALKRDHPAEYDAGMQAYLSPLQQNPYFPGMNPAMMSNPAYRARFYPGMPGFPERPSPALQIPARKAGTTNAP